MQGKLVQGLYQCIECSIGKMKRKMETTIFFMVQGLGQSSLTCSSVSGRNAGGSGGNEKSFR